MANWKKMAEAFGRAMGDPGSSREGHTLIKRGSKDATQYKIDADDNGKIKLVPGDNFDADVNEAFETGKSKANAEDRKDIQLGYNRDERQARFDERTEQHTDDALAKEWDDAFKQSTDKFKSQSSSLTDEDADAWKSELLRTIDELRKRGFSDADILNTIKGK